MLPEQPISCKQWSFFENICSTFSALLYIYIGKKYIYSAYNKHNVYIIKHKFPGHSIQPHFQASDMLSAHLSDLADTMQLRQNTLPALTTHITNRIKKSTVAPNAAADRRDRACSSKVRNSTETTPKCFSWKGGIQRVNMSSHRGWGSWVPCSHLCPSDTGSMCPGRIYRRCKPDARSPTAPFLATAGETEKVGRAGGRQKSKGQEGDQKIAAMHHFFLYFQQWVVV